MQQVGLPNDVTDAQPSPPPGSRRLVHLSHRRRRFVNEFLKDHNATQAAIRAGYSKIAAGNAGCRLLKNEDISREIQRLERKLEDKIEADLERTLAEYAAIGFAPVDLSNVRIQDKIAALDSRSKIKGYMREVGATGAVFQIGIHLEPNAQPEPIPAIAVDEPESHNS